MPAPPFKQHNAGGDRDVERRDGSGHGDAHQQIAVFLDQFVEALALAAQDEHSGPGIIGFAIQLGAALVQPVNPEAALLEHFESLADVSDANHRQMLEGSGGSFGDYLGESRRPALGNKNGGCARGMGGANNGAQVMWILNAVEQRQQLDSGSRENFVELGIALGGSEGQDPLVRGAVRGAVECLARLKAYRHGTFAGQIDDLLNTRSTGSASDQNAVERPRGAQRFPYRVETGQEAAGLA